ncbi:MULTISPECIES: glycosyltransferase [unclassified Archaeoglobus]|uniref:glycosyltransferase n=1 Tax=unclassified Archaeoglobus TaxID=2643606 RepID=UPI0025BDDF82|nr:MULTISPECIES: glycosyltransferase [unclassified Archaeoglobus]
MKVSVVVCTYSPAMLNHFIECIESLISQNYENTEIICIVDGNRGYYDKIKNKYGEFFRENNIKLFLNEKNLGLLLSRNRGVELAEGDVVAFIDDDAVADEKWIEELVKMYRNGAIAAGGKLVPLWVAKKPRWFPEEFYWMIGATHLGFPDTVTEVRNTFGSNISFRRDVFLELGGFNPEMGGIKGRRMLQGGETELCERMRKKYGRGVMYNPNAIVYHKIFEGRTKLGFLARRAFWQGYSKAVMERVAGKIGEEKSFLGYLVRGRVAARLKGMARGNLEDGLKLVAMLFFTGVVGLGYLWGKVAGR